MRIVIFSELSKGGIADYAHDQAAALADMGVEVDLVCSPDFLDSRTPNYRVQPILKELRGSTVPRSRLLRRANLALGIIENWKVFCRYAAQSGTQNVLTHFSEYLAPVWAPSVRRLRTSGTKFFSVLHDTDRNYVVGPQWWHHRSVHAAYSILDGVFVHALEEVRVPDHVEVVTVPHGIYTFPEATRSRDEVRRGLKIPSDAFVLISFGYIRDNKNLDLVLEAIRDSEIYLIVAGREQEGGNRPVEYYRSLAAAFGCADRCRWLNRFLTGSEIADLFAASDFSMLTYSRAFVSASAALSVTTNYRTPCIVSSGSGTMRALVEKYGIGVWVEPDNVEEIRAGIARSQSRDRRPAWEGYAAEQSWAKNAEIVAAAFDATRRSATHR